MEISFQKCNNTASSFRMLYIRIELKFFIIFLMAEIKIEIIKANKTCKKMC